MAESVDRLTQLERALEAQHKEIGHLKQQLKSSSEHEAEPERATPPREPASSRRLLLKGGVLAAGATVATTVAAQSPAAAANGDNITVGGYHTGTSETVLEGNDELANNNILTVSDLGGGSLFPAAIGGYGYGNAVQNGLYGYSNSRSDTDVDTGHAVVAWRDIDGRSNLLLRARGTDPINDNYRHQAGEVVAAADGTLWYCVSGGTPGTWRVLASNNTSGALHAISPARIYDSRFASPLSLGSNRTISAANSIDVGTGAVDITDVVPEGATAVQFNLTVVGNTGGGFLLVAPGGQTTITASTINFPNATTTLANASLSTLNSSRQLSVLSGGSGTTHFIVDITAYMM